MLVPASRRFNVSRAVHNYKHAMSYNKKIRKFIVKHMYNNI
jgi:hypothetical protein